MVTSGRKVTIASSRNPAFDRREHSAPAPIRPLDDVRPPAANGKESRGRKVSVAAMISLRGDVVAMVGRTVEFHDHSRCAMKHVSSNAAFPEHHLDLAFKGGKLGACKDVP